MQAYKPIINGYQVIYDQANPTREEIKGTPQGQVMAKRLGTAVKAVTVVWRLCLTVLFFRFLLRAMYYGHYGEKCYPTLKRKNESTSCGIQLWMGVRPLSVVRRLWPIGLMALRGISPQNRLGSFYLGYPLPRVGTGLCKQCPSLDVLKRRNAWLHIDHEKTQPFHFKYLPFERKV